MDTKQPEALRLAEMLERPGYGWNSTIEQYAAELRRLHAENEAMRTGYNAARLEVASLQAEVAKYRESMTAGAYVGCVVWAGDAKVARHLSKTQVSEWRSPVIALQVLTDVCASELARFLAKPGGSAELLRKTNAAARGTPAADAPTTAAALSRACDLLSSTIGILMGQRAKIAYTDNSPIAALVNEAVDFLRPWPEQLPSSAASPVVLPEHWAVCVGGRIWIGKTPEHVLKLAEQECMEPTLLYTEQQVRAMLAAEPQLFLQPLTKSQIWDAIRPLTSSDEYCAAIIDISMDEYRAIERANGIAGDRHGQPT